MPRYAKPVLAGFIVAFVVAAGLTLLSFAGEADPGFTPALVGMIFGVFTTYILANLAGNRRGKAAGEDERRAAVALRPSEGMGMLIVMREGFVAKAAGLDIMVDGQVITQLKSPRFAAVQLSPGRHDLRLAFGGLAASQSRPAEEAFGLGAGEVAAYRVTMQMGALKGSIRLERIPADPALAGRLKGMTMTALER